MKRQPANFPLLYWEVLRRYLEPGRKTALGSAAGLGNKALAAGLLTLDLAKLHESILVMDLLPAYPAEKRTELIKQAGMFFAAAIAPENPDSIALEASHLKETIETLSDRTVELAAANQLLSLEIIRRKEIESSLRKSELDCLEVLEKSNHLREQMRELSRRILSAQEDERKKISRELHDVIAQELMGINVRLATLKTAAGNNAKDLNRNIAHTQKMVTKSANIVHQLARELRPTSLDDLGLIPSLHSFMKDFTSRTGVRTHLTAFAGLDKLNSAMRTVLYRVAQEALCNVGRHAHASRADVIIRRQSMSVRMEVTDDGKSFDAHAEMAARGNKHLGLLGMRERVEMIAGVFQIESAPGKGTTIITQIPVTKATVRAWDHETPENKLKIP
jgi:signal transduction histidine kinase